MDPFKVAFFFDKFLTNKIDGQFNITPEKNQFRTYELNQIIFYFKIR